MNFDKLFKTQPKVVEIIQNSIMMNRLVQVMIFEGAKGTPKMDAAKYLASMLLCKSKSACLECKECKRIENNIHPRLYYIDAIDKSIKKEQIQELEYEFSKSGIEEGTRVIIINNIDKATVSASNSLLKFLEEIKEDVYCILITDNISNVLGTIKSRSQIISFQRISSEEIVSEYVSKGIDFEVSKVLSKITNDVSEGLKIIEDGYILDIIDLVKDINSSFFDDVEER